MMLRAGFSEKGNMDRVLIFTRTKHGADRVVKLLAGNGIAANAIHGNKSQPQRERALGEFKSGKVKILIATDIRSEEHTSELQSLMRISYAVFCLKKKKKQNHNTHT